MKKIAILGSTGSIGQNTLKIARHLNDQIQVVALAARGNIDMLEAQAREFHPQLIAVYDEQQAAELQRRLPNIPVLAGMEGLKAVASCDAANFVISAISGTMGLLPTLAAIDAKKTVGLANKETLVSGGAIVMQRAKANGVQILPIDSEHSALFQCLQGHPMRGVKRLILTASGGPFRTFSDDQLQQVTVEQALRHPTWAMGAKVTIDCSTLMNKGLEVIEAHWLFDMPLDKISVLVHPQSVIHSMVEFIDNSFLAQLGESSMITPIQYVLTYPERAPSCLAPFDFLKHHTLQFFAPDEQKFPCLRLAREAIQTGGSLPCYMNAANEVLVNRFVDRRLGWHEIPVKLEALMSRHAIRPINTTEDVLEVDKQARLEAQIF